MLTWSTVHMYIQYNRKECNLLHQSFCPASWRIQPVNLCHIWRLNSAQWWENYKCDLAANAHTASPLNHVISVVPMKMGWSACLVPRSSLAQNFCLGMKLIGRGLLLWQEAHICSGELIGTPEWKQEYGGRWRGGWRGGWPESLTMKFITKSTFSSLYTTKDTRYETTYGLSIAYFPGYLCVNKTRAFSYMENWAGCASEWGCWDCV